MNNGTQELIIIGASGLGKEVAWLARRLNLVVKGFLDDNPSLEGSSFYDYPILGNLSEWSDFPTAGFVIAISAPRVRRRVATQMESTGYVNFVTLIDPSAIVEIDCTQIGSGTVVCAGTVVTADISIGKHCVINKLCSIGHDVTIDDYVTVAPKVMLGGYVHLKSGVEVGAASAVRQGVRINSGAMVGMGSTVLKDVAPNMVVVGAPVRQLKSLETF